MKEVPHSLLKAFGFRKALKTSGFSNKTWFQPELVVYYDPTLHDEHEFTRNLIMGVIHYRLSNEDVVRTRKILDMKDGEW